MKNGKVLVIVSLNTSKKHSKKYIEVKLVVARAHVGGGYGQGLGRG